jgi:osmotically-inducible protein OsmY
MHEDGRSLLEEYVTEVREAAGFRRTDEDIREEICHALADDVGLDARGVRVAVEHGRVTLSGTVRHCADRHRAARHACAVPGVLTVQNELQPSDEAGVEVPQRGAAATMGKPDYER